MKAFLCLAWLRVYIYRAYNYHHLHPPSHLPTYLRTPAYTSIYGVHAVAVPPYHGAPQHDTKHTMDTSCGTPWNTSTARTSLGNDPSTSLYLSLFSVTLTSFMVSFTLSPFLPRLPTVRPSIRPFVRLSTFPSFLSPPCLCFFLLFCSLSLSL